MSVTLYVATSNPGKLRDFAEAARSHGSTVRLLPLPRLERIPAPPEDGAAFEENAIAKAIAYSRYAPGQIVLADDSGLEVDALDCAPGVHSARYAAAAEFDPDPHARLTSDERNNLFLLANLRGVPAGRRSARFRCVLAAARNSKCIALGCGEVEGSILDTPRGSGGFGYDPLFLIPGFGRTMAELSLEEKLRVSHRGRALRDLLEKLPAESRKGTR